MTMRVLLTVLVAALCAPGASADGFELTAAPDGAAAYIISPQNGASLASPVTVRFGLTGIGVAPAGIDAKNTGHHHLLIDVADLPDISMPLPATEHVRHFGGGQTEVVVELSLGTHSLQLLLGDHRHIPHDPPIMSEIIVITVTE